MTGGLVFCRGTASLRMSCQVSVLYSADSHALKTQTSTFLYLTEQEAGPQTPTNVSWKT